MLLPSHIPFSLLRLQRDTEGHLRYERSVLLDFVEWNISHELEWAAQHGKTIKPICHRFDADPELAQRAIASWYLFHRAHGGSEDAVAETVIAYYEEHGIGPTG